MALMLRVLGGIRIEHDGEPVQGRAAQRRRLALLAALSVMPGHASRREKLAAMLWPDAAPDAGRRLLTEALHVFRRELHPEVVTGAGDEVRINREVVGVDAAEFRDALERRDLERAVEVYGGAFLDGFNGDEIAGFGQWVDGERAKLRRQYADALEALATAADEAADFAAAAEWWGKLSFEDRYGSGVALKLMQALVRAGEHARALQFGTAFVRRLREDLGLEPGREVAEFLARLRADPPPPPPATPSPAPAAGGEPSAPAAGEQISPEFQVVRQIGEGSVATVYLAREPALGRHVAVKVLADRFRGDETTQRRFEREARAAARIHHPNVATVYRIGRTTAGMPFLVLPYVEGGTLADRRDAAGELSVAEVRRYVAQAAAGLAAAHRLGVVHRDVRPANLLYDRAADRVLLTDFGLAAILDTFHEDALRLTRPGEVLGDPRYTSPEQLLGDAVTGRADVYSLGIVAFELLTGTLPFTARGGPALLAAHARERPRRVLELRPEVSPELDALVDRCLHKRPEQRPFAADIAEALGWI
ncbi:MAG TPA: protein kinase [Longimicrobium sp.]|nr:protein kinase [Longimicrobium sp.]